MKHLKDVLLAGAVALLPVAALADTITLASTVPDSGVNRVVTETLVGALGESSPETTVDIFLDGSLGGERELLDLLRLGETDIHMGVIHASLYFPELDATLVPYLFPDYASIQAFLASETGDRLKAALEEKGNAKFLGTYYQGARWTTANRPFRTLDDLKGLKIRMPEIPLWIKIWSGMGATTTPMPSPEVFSGLQTGVIDAQENMLSNILGRRLYEVQSHLIATEHQHSYITIMANLDFWNGLDAEAQAKLQAAIDKATAAGSQSAFEENQSLIDEIVASGVELVQPDPSFRTDSMEIIRAAANSQLEPGIYEKAVEVIETKQGTGN
ncbi:TRAP transporter substrate-binding protein [Salipiger mangrovisoli]|uniref:TRAP transporter substrate-binding protein n=1 Tax=Salipiger mangrovisoli TaxID=2865933 RepID=A0ABR9X544_9RHOB|nr:TRAP transporter substrate-binding protein [Salipiger mangrovisoli]MBE9638639.1 TRAP transporter substrate-binding protein [Salipiger mangrovisoli]